MLLILKTQKIQRLYMTLPDFIICRAQKSGTSSLSHLFSQHLEICETVCKEMHFFCWDETYREGEEWYEKKVQRL